MNHESTTRPTFVPTPSDLFVKEINTQTLSAWLPYWDCVGMNFELQNSDIDDEHPEWRMHWVFAVVMLRTVGHVLAKVDSRKSNVHERVIQGCWTQWKAHKAENWVFWDFIENERNNILKAYEFGVELDEHGLWHAGLGEDGVQLMREGTYWWRSELENIERALVSDAGAGRR